VEADWNRVNSIIMQRVDERPWAAVGYHLFKSEKWSDPHGCAG